MAEIELGMPAGKCLDRRIPDPEVLTQESDNRRERAGIRADRQFTTQDAGAMPKSRYS